MNRIMQFRMLALMNHGLNRIIGLFVYVRAGCTVRPQVTHQTCSVTATGNRWR